jgi:hypothetical protein
MASAVSHAAMTPAKPKVERHGCKLYRRTAVLIHNVLVDQDVPPTTKAAVADVAKGAADAFRPADQGCGDSPPSELGRQTSGQVTAMPVGPPQCQ